MIPHWFYALLIAFIMLFVGVVVYNEWKKGAQQLIAFSSVMIVMLFVSVVVNPERFS